MCISCIAFNEMGPTTYEHSGSITLSYALLSNRLRACYAYISR